MKAQNLVRIFFVLISLNSLFMTAFSDVKINDEKQKQIDPAFLNLSKKLPLPTYEPVKYRFDKIPWLTTEQLSEHIELYKGYVKKENEIAKALTTIDRSKANGITYSEFRSLKLAETFAMNGDILHQLYFENISDKQSITPGEQMMNFIIEAFGSLDAFKKDLFACATSSRGWVLTGYSLHDNRIHNFVLEAHNQTVPVLVMPLITLDVYEHAYFLDFGTKRPSYVDRFWNNINWNVVEERVNMWVNPLIKKCEETKNDSQEKEKQSSTKK